MGCLRLSGGPYIATVKLFLDVDGVLLAGDRLAPHAIGFLQFATENFECYWLTTHVRDHDTVQVMRHLMQATPGDQQRGLFDVASKVMPAPWAKWMSDALPRDGRFAWLDDSPTATELDVLRQRGQLLRWRYDDVNDEPDDLLSARKWLEDRTGASQSGLA
jgi:hypothetical protein